jgi:hypothetical protein
MSIFQHTTVACPACDTSLAFDLVVSVSADRRPDLRDAILDGSFQRVACSSCGARFRVPPEFTYIDIGRGQYIGAWPASRRADWREAAARTQASFDRAFGTQADAAARKIGDKLELRAVFGWPALHEKLLARAAGIDDRTLEVAKVAMISRLESAPLPGQRELRLVAAGDTELTFGWVEADTQKLSDLLQVPRTLLAEIEAGSDVWRGLRDEVAEGPVVDFQREMLVA